MKNVLPPRNDLPNPKYSFEGAIKVGKIIEILTSVIRRNITLIHYSRGKHHEISQQGDGRWVLGSTESYLRRLFAKMETNTK